MRPAVSVVIPTFQRSGVCVRAVRSALAQNPPVFEVLVCDDGSTDSTERVFTGWADREPRLRYLRLPRNSAGPAAPRNLGVSRARGTWVAFLDDDDLWLPGKVARQLTATGRSDVITANARLPDGGYYRPQSDRRSRSITRRQLLFSNPVILSSAMVRRHLLLEVGGFPQDRYLAGIEDYCLWMKLADRGARFCLLEDPLVLYDSASGGRLSSLSVARLRALARYSARRWSRQPWDPTLAMAALRHAITAARKI